MLSQRKVSNVEVVASSEVSHEDVASFSHALNLSNFAYTEKTTVLDLHRLGEDPRFERYQASIDSVTLHHETYQPDSKNQTISDSVNFARELANRRATECDPDYLEGVI